MDVSLERRESTLVARELETNRIAWFACARCCAPPRARWVGKPAQQKAEDCCAVETADVIQYLDHKLFAGVFQECAKKAATVAKTSSWANSLRNSVIMMKRASEIQLLSAAFPNNLDNFTCCKANGISPQCRDIRMFDSLGPVRAPWSSSW